MMKFILPKIIIDFECWKWNAEYEIYVSNMGNFKDRYKQPIPRKIYSKDGYVYIKTKYGNKLAHRLVMLTWRPIPDRESFTVDHLNHNKRDNRLCNLEWVTAYENKERAAKDLIRDVNPTVTSLTLRAYNHKENHIFNGIEEAVSFIKKKNPAASNETIRKNINKTISNKKQYCSLTWAYI